MSKSKKEVQRELYHFIGDQEEPVIQQTVFDKFCKKYNCSTRTINRYLEEMCNSKNPFHLRTWYDKNRYYEVPMITIRGKITSVASIAVPLFFFFVDLYDPLHTRWHLFLSSSFFFAGYWIAMWISVLPKGKVHHSDKKISKELNTATENR